MAERGHDWNVWVDLPENGRYLSTVMRRFRKWGGHSLSAAHRPKLRLRRVVPNRGERLLYCDHIDADSEPLFRVACEHELEGIVAKRRGDPYLPQHASWLKIRSDSYSQVAGARRII